MSLLPLLFSLVTSAWAGGVLRAEVSALRSDQGSVLCALYSSYEGFPGDPQKALVTISAQIQSGKAICEFARATPGTYAVSVVHDEDSDGKMKTGWFGIPKEGVGASNDAKGSFGPPKFNAARFDYPGGALVLKIHLVYL